LENFDRLPEIRIRRKAINMVPKNVLPHFIIWFAIGFSSGTYLN
jgi:hypothetical protein